MRALLDWLGFCVVQAACEIQQLLNELLIVILSTDSHTNKV